MTSLALKAISRPRERPARPAAAIRVAARPGDKRRGLLAVAGAVLPCALGRSGIGALKREGDGVTPRGTLTLLGGFYRRSRWPIARRAPWLVAAPEAMGWCDAPGDPNYNRAVRLPFDASCETLWRDDDLYDCVLVLDWNITRRARNRGSAIFLHLARPGFAPTEGCIAVERAAMARILRALRPGMRIATGGQR